MSSENLILGSATGYTAAALELFLRSAYENIPGSRVLLVSERTDDAFRKQLAAFHPRLHLWHPPDSERRSRMWRSRRRQRRIKKLSTAEAFRRRAALWTPWSTIGLAAFHPVVVRYFYFHSILKQGLDGGAKRILLADTRDVFFQGDPFEYSKDTLITGAESRQLNEDSHLFRYIRETYSTPVAEKLLQNPVLCSGVLLGQRQVVFRLVEAMVREFRWKASRVFGKFADQIIFNKLLHCDASIPFTPIPEGHPLLTQLLYSDPSLHRLEHDGFKTTSGEIVRIVHRFDRYRELVAYAEGRWNIPPETGLGEDSPYIRPTWPVTDDHLAPSGNEA